MREKLKVSHQERLADGLEGLTGWGEPGDAVRV